MKITSAHSSVVAAVLTAAVVLFLVASSISRADTSAPMFGAATLTIDAETFDWSSATEDGTWHYDFYTNGNHSLTVTGMIGFPDLATVEGTSDLGTVNGYWNAGSYGACYQSLSESGSWEQNGLNYTERVTNTQYAVNLALGQLEVVSSSVSYNGPNGTYSYSSDGGGNWSSSQNTQTSTDTSSPSSGQSSIELFGTTYAFVSGTQSSGAESASDSTGYTFTGSCYANWTDNYRSPDDGTLSIAYAGLGFAGNMTMETTSISGWDPYAGNFSVPQGLSMGTFHGFADLTWEVRTAATFAPAQLWFNGLLVNWQWGEIDSDGMITDHYEQGGSEVLVIRGHAREFNQGAEAVVYQAGYTVTLNTYTASGGFANNLGYDIQTSEPGSEPEPDPDPGSEPEPDPGPQPTISGTPFFTSATSLWVNGTEYPFYEGYEDGYGNRSDSYINGSVGTVTLSGNTSNPSHADVNASYYGGIDYGWYDGGDSFQLYQYSISISPPYTEPEPDPGPDPVYGSDAYWVRGQMYVRFSSDSNTFQAASGQQFTLSSSDGGSSLMFSGADSQGGYTGIYDNNGQPGLRLIANEQAAGTLLPVIPANVDGTLQLSGDAPDANAPPALMLTGRGIWQFIGMVNVDGAGTAAYANALAAGSSELSEGGGQMLLINLTEINAPVTLANYLTGETLNGLYNQYSRLFQTGAQNSLPVPIYGVDPNENHALWGLGTPESGPATFLVGGQVWHYAGGDGTGNTFYSGYYDGQQLTLGAAATNGQRLVSVTHDGGTTQQQGTLNDVRGSVRLANGTMVYSGHMDGVRITPTIDENNLSAIPGNLDIAGNLISLGSLSGDAATAGATIQFSDNGSTALLGTALGRSNAQWIWWRADPNNVTGYVPTMAVDSTWGLALYDPANPTTATIQLNPATGVIKLNGQPVLTESEANARYLKAGDGGLVLGSLTAGVHAADSVAVGANSMASSGSVSIGVLAGANGLNNPYTGFRSVAIGYQARPQGGNAIAIGHGTFAPGGAAVVMGYGSAALQAGGVALGNVLVSNQIGQVVLGSYNLLSTESTTKADTDDIFVIGNGNGIPNDAKERSNAFVIKRNGDVQVMGALSVNGQPVLTQSGADARYLRTDQVGGENSTILTQDSADTRYLQKGQPLRVTPSGDIPMGEFTNGTQP